MVILAILVFLLAIAIRTILFYKYKFLGTDSFYHLLRSSAIKKEGRVKELTQGSSKISQLLVTPKWWSFYPNFFDIIVSLFPKSFHKNLRFLPAFFDILSMILLYFFVTSIFNSDIALLPLLVYAISPIMILVSLPISPRTFANFFMILSTLSLFMFLSTGSIIFFLLSSVFASIIFLSHKLTLQSLSIVFLVESIVFKSFIPLLSLFAGFLIGVVVTKGFYIHILSAHAKLLVFFFRKGINSKRKLYELAFTFGSFSFILVILFIPQFILVQNLTEVFIQAWFFSLLLASIFWLWGDSYRYMTNAVFPGSILIALYLFNFTNVYVIAMFLIAIVISFVGITKILKSFTKPPKIIDSDILSCFAYVKKHSKHSDILLTIPQHYHLAASYFTNILTLETNEKAPKQILSTGKIFKNKVSWVVSYNKVPSKIFKQKFSKGKFFVYKSK